MCTYFEHRGEKIVREEYIFLNTRELICFFFCWIRIRYAKPHKMYFDFFFKLYAFILLTSTLVPGINYFDLFLE